VDTDWGLPDTELHRPATQPLGWPAGVCCVMVVVVGIDELFDQHFARLVRSLAVAFDAESAADAVQEAFIAADRRWSTVSGYDDPAGWVRRVAVNRLLNRRRNLRRRVEILDGIRTPLDEDLTPDLLDLRAAMRQLPDTMRVTIGLHYLGGFTVAEIATGLDVAVGTVKSNLHDGRTRLRELLAEDAHG
jgi:RNA polymerase sigma-70 factor, ECF subfamily